MRRVQRVSGAIGDERSAAVCESSGVAIKWEGVFLRRLFQRFAVAPVRYAVMRNFESLPEDAGGSDLDIWIAPEDEQCAMEEIVASVHDSGGVPIGIARSPGHFKVFALGCVESPRFGWWGLRIDVNVGLYFRGMRLLEENSPPDVREHHGVSVFTRELSGVLGVLKELLNNSVLPARYVVDAREAARTTESWNNVSRQLRPMGQDALDILRNILRHDSGKENIPIACKFLRNALSAEAYRAEPIATLKRRVQCEWSKVWRYLRPSGMVIAISGGRPAERFAVFKELGPMLAAATHGAVYRHQTRLGQACSGTELRYREKASDELVLGSASLGFARALASMVRGLRFSAGYVFDYWVSVRPVIGRQPAIVVADGYPHDLAKKNEAARSLLERVTSTMLALAPGPDLVILLADTSGQAVVEQGALPIVGGARWRNLIRRRSAEKACEVVMVRAGASSAGADLADAVVRAIRLERIMRYSPNGERAPGGRARPETVAR